MKIRLFLAAESTNISIFFSQCTNMFMPGIPGPMEFGGGLIPPP